MDVRSCSCSCFEGHWRPECWGRYIANLPRPGADGSIQIPSEPGLGVQIDWGIIARFGKRIYHGTQVSVSRFVLFERGMKNALYLKKKRQEKSRPATPSGVCTAKGAILVRISLTHTWSIRQLYRPFRRSSVTGVLKR